MKSKIAQPECRFGHELTRDNRVVVAGRSECRACAVSIPDSPRTPQEALCAHGSPMLECQWCRVNERLLEAEKRARRELIAKRAAALKRTMARLSGT